METTYENSNAESVVSADNRIDVSPLATSHPSPAPAVAPSAITATANAKPSKGGPPRQNINRCRTGTKTRRYAIGTYPKPLCRVERAVRAYRRSLEADAIAVHGELTAELESLIDEATGLFSHDCVCCWLLRNRFDVMSPSEIRANSKERTEAKASRNAIIAKLKLGKESAGAGDDPWAAFDANRQIAPNALGKVPGFLAASKPQQSSEAAGTLPSVSASPTNEISEAHQ